MEKNREEISANLKNPGIWRRIIYMMLFALILGVVRMLLWVVVAFQVVTALITGSRNPYAQKFGRSLSAYIYQVLLFLTFNTEEMPFPFADWEPAVNEDETTERRP